MTLRLLGRCGLLGVLELAAPHAALAQDLPAAGAPRAAAPTSAAPSSAGASSAAASASLPTPVLSLAEAGAATATRASPPAARVTPNVREVVQMVRRASRSLSPERIRALARRARLSGLVPSLRLGADRGMKQNLTESSSNDTERTNASLGDDISLDATLTFDLPRLVFATEEVRLLSVERWLVQDRKKLLDEAVKLYFQWRRLRTEVERAGAPDEELEFALAETEALLDALTDGAFGGAAHGEGAAPEPRASP